jgi:hypothetical protein
MRHQYNDGKSQNLPRIKQPLYVQMAQPKIRKHVSYFRNLHKDIKNKDMFNKEPTIYYGEHPESYNYDKNLDTT